MTMYRYSISQNQELPTILQQSNNSVHNVSTETCDEHSSSGPIYEQIDNGNQQDHTYSILERDESPDCCSTQLYDDIDKEQSYHVVESEGCEGVEGAGCDSVYSEASSGEVTNNVEQNKQQGVTVWRGLLHTQALRELNIHALNNYASVRMRKRGIR